MELPVEQDAVDPSRQIGAQSSCRACERASVGFSAQAVLEEESLPVNPEIAGQQVRSCRVENRAQRVDGTRGQHVVGIDKPEVIAAGTLQQAVAGGGESAIARMTQQAKGAAEARSHVRNDGRARIGRGIVENDDFDALAELHPYRMQAIGQEVGHVEHRYQNTQPRPASLR